MTVETQLTPSRTELWQWHKALAFNLVSILWLAHRPETLRTRLRLLLPVLDSEDEPSGEELAAALHFQLARLEAMQNAGARSPGFVCTRTCCGRRNIAQERCRNRRLSHACADQ